MDSEILRGVRAVITGAGSGIGRALAIGLSRKGADLALVGRRVVSLEETASLLSKNSHWLAVTGDLSIPDEVEAVCKQICKTFPVLDLLINCAAPYVAGSLEICSADELREQIDTTLTGTMLMTKHLLTSLRAADQPHLVNILSTAALPDWHIDATTSSPAFYAARWGQAGFTEAVRDELAAAGIRVSGIYPGAVSPDERKPGMLEAKDVVDAALFAITRPRGTTIRSLVLSG